MENFRFILEPYNRHQRNRYTCPSCGKHREFTRYIDTQGAISFPEYVGNVTESIIVVIIIPQQCILMNIRNVKNTINHSLL